MHFKPKASSPQLPHELTPMEEARGWDEHRDYWDMVKTEDERVDRLEIRRTKPVNLRLSIDMIEGLKREGAKRALPYPTLIRMWLKERLDAENPDPTR